MRRCCRPSDEESELSDPLVNSPIQVLHDVRDALEMQCRRLWYQCIEQKLKAKRFKIEGNQIRCLAELRHRQEMMDTYQRYVNLHLRINSVLLSIQEAHTVNSVAINLGAANKLFNTLQESLDIGKIETLMDSLDGHHEQIREVAMVLGGERVGEFDEATALAELDREDEIEFPSLAGVERKERVFA